MDKKLLEFLITAKKATYAGKGAETTSSRIKSHDLIYEDGDYMYYDTYLGTGKFAGEEAIWIKDVPYWSMNYIGRVIGANFSGDFLKNNYIPTYSFCINFIIYFILILKNKQRF